MTITECYNKDLSNSYDYKMKDPIPTIKDVEILPSLIHGKGLFTTRERTCGEVITVLDGQLVQHNDDIDFLLTYEWNAISNTDILLRPLWTYYGYINHSSNCNLTFNLYTHTLITLTDIPAGTEMTIDYLEHGFPESYLTSSHGVYLR